MASNTIIWDPGTSSFIVTLPPPGKPNGNLGAANIQINGTPLTPEVTNRVFSTYSGPPSGGQGFGYSWWQIPPPSGGTSPTWNIQGPAFGNTPTIFYIQPTYQDANGWHTYTNPPSQSGDTYTFNDPTGGGSSSITVTMVEPGGGGLSM